RSVELPARPLPAFSEDASRATAELGDMAADHETVALCDNEGEAHRMNELLGEFAPSVRLAVQTQYMHRGLIWGGDERRPPLALVPYHELLHRYQLRRRIRRLAGGRATEAFVDLQPGDYVVHRDHGIARFAGLGALPGAAGGEEEFLTLEFAGRAKLHVPASKIDLVQRYIGAVRDRPELSALGGQRWGRQKEKVREAVQDLAAEMLQIEAAREAKPGIRYPADTTWQCQFEAEFPYEETEDQLTAVVAVKRDMCDPRPMDRLVCGDVGFGKTEVAVRAAFKAAEYGKQVAVLVPTTVLAEQHERVFGERFADYPFRVESLSRFKTRKEQTALLQALRKGQVDIVIGTHRLISKDVRFADLGLVIIDEEQRFGVEHKQRLLEFRTTADVLTLSATPIPRTLHMAMLGLRDISSLSTAPLDRRAIVTELIPHNRRRIKQAIDRELAREGQVFFVHNRVYNIQSVADEIQQLAPEARVIVAHGQMPTRQLESVMLNFIRREADILVCTTIIESGIDIPTVNTMFISNAHRFGLSELHQLRGRVGRYKHRAYCYLLLPADRVISETAVKRLRAIENFSMLGAGFKVALRDLEIRGAGNLLGPEQSGHIAAVGYEMYCQLLEQAVADLKERPGPLAVVTTVDIGVTGCLPQGYVPSGARRMDAYRRISGARSQDELAQVRSDLASAYGEPPAAAERLLQLVELRIAASPLGIRTVTRHEGDIIFKTRRPADLQQCMAGAKGTLRLVGNPDPEGLVEVYYRPPQAYLEEGTLLLVLCRRLRGEAQVMATSAGKA
ncbi:MAG: transcription-repair coupling factor, partial [Planctomycetota bacterium]